VVRINNTREYEYSQYDRTLTRAEEQRCVPPNKDFCTLRDSSNVREHYACAFCAAKTRPATNTTQTQDGRSEVTDAQIPDRRMNPNCCAESDGARKRQRLPQSP